VCGEVTGQLEVHHVRPLALGGQEIAPPGDLIAVCKFCHDGLGSRRARV
jgi:predicted HNH restriction endonuclease